MNNLLLQGGTVIDGTGSAGRRADVRIRDGRIAEVAPDLKANGETVLDVSGAVVSPGFIDSHTHFDASVFWDPMCDPIPQHGVTSVIIGNCSLGLAPVRKADQLELTDVFSYIEDIPFEAFTDAVPWNWESFHDYAGVLRQLKLGVHVGAFVGHSMIRSYIMGAEAWERAPTDAEADRIAAELDSALAAGALGISSSRFDQDRNGRLVPSYYKSDYELNLIFKTLKAHNAMFQVIPRSATVEVISEDLIWISQFAGRHDTPVMYNGISDFHAEPDRIGRLLALVKQFQNDGIRILPLFSPRAIEFMVGFEQSMTFMNHPTWNEMIQAPMEAKRGMLRDPAWRARARVDFEKCENTVMFPSDRIHDLRIVSVNKPELEAWIGKSLADLVAERGGHPSDVMADWVLENDLQALFVNPLSNLNVDRVGDLVRNPHLLLSGSDAGAHLQMFCGVGDTTLLLTRYVRERGDMSLEAMIHELTGRQADLLNLNDRGYIAPGKVADITVFALDELTFEPEKLVSDVPGGKPRLRRPPGGYRYTIVNGVVVQQSGDATGALPARFLTGTDR